MNLRTLVMLLVLVTPALAVSQDCIDYGDYLHWATRVNTPGEPRDVAICSLPQYPNISFAIVADGQPGGLQVIDVTDPVHPELVGGVDTLGGAEGVVVVGSYAYVADLWRGLQVVDLADPANPLLVGGVDTPCYTYGVAVAGSHAYAVCGQTGFHVIDISTPETPFLVSTLEIPGDARAVQVAGDFAYVANFAGSLQVIDVSTPDSPTLVATTDLPGEALGLTVSGDFAFVASSGAGLQVVDISTPGSPTVVGAVATSGTAVGVAIAGDRAYVVGDRCDIVDISTPASPTILGGINTGGLRVAVAGDHAYVATGNTGLQIIVVSSDEPPPLAAALELPGDAMDVVANGDLAFVVDGTGFHVVDVSTPGFPVEVGGVDIPGAKRVSLDGDLACTITGSELFVVDVTTPEFPAILGEVEFSPAFAITCGDVAVAGDHAYVVASWTGGFTPNFYVVDLTVPEFPVVVGGYGGNWSYGVAVDGDHAYVVGNGGFSVIDVTNPEIPAFVTSIFGVHDSLRDVTVMSDLAYVAGGHPFLGGSGLQIIDITTPAAPISVASVATPGYGNGVALAGDHAYVAGGSSGLQVIDVTSPGIPFPVGGVDTPGDPSRVAVASSFVCVADGESGLQIAWRQCDAGVGIGDGSGNPNSDDADSDREVPDAELRLSVGPNPFNPQTTVTFSLPRAQPIDIDVYDLQGQRVRRLAGGTYPQGEHVLTWDGRNSQGREVPSGVYLVRLATEERVQATKVTMIR